MDAVDDRTPGEGFYVVAYEAGRESGHLPTWADAFPGNVTFCADPCSPATRIDVPGVPGAFQIADLLTDRECLQFVRISEALGYRSDSPVSLPHSIRHNDNVNWVVEEHIDKTIWERCRRLFGPLGDSVALGLNARFRFYRYREGDYFEPHTDGEWPGSRVRDGRLLHDAYGDRLSRMTCLLFLSDGYVGGRTVFHVNSCRDGSGARTERDEVVSVTTPKGAALCFPHGRHPLHCVHAGERVSSGTKYIIRTDVLYTLPA